MRVCNKFRLNRVVGPHVVAPDYATEFDDLDFEEIDELGEDEEFHEQNGESHTTEADPVSVTPQPLAETITESDTASLPSLFQGSLPFPLSFQAIFVYFFKVSV